MVVEQAASAGTIQKPDANLRYLDIAVLLELWDGWGLTQLLDELMPAGDSLVSPAAVVATLCLQRCIEPNTKWYATQWFPRTALPELLDLPSVHFNNTRLHRVLEELDSVSSALMRRLPRLYTDREGSFAAMFLDVTDSWFVGDGPTIAEPAKTKEGRFERKINIVLLCNEKGYPLRWKVIPGRRHDSEAMTDIVESIRGLSWLGRAPVVLDRAMGKTAHLRRLLATDVRFLTALTRSEFASYTDRVPYQRLLELELSSTAVTPEEEGASAEKLVEKAAMKKDMARAARLVEKAGMEKVSSDLYLLDLGVVTHADNKTATEKAQVDEAREPTVHKTVQAIRFGRKLRSDLDEGRAGNYRSAGKPYGLGKEQVYRCLQLVSLPQDLQEAVLRGEASSLSVNDLLRIAKLEDVEQHGEFSRLVAEASTRQDKRRQRGGAMGQSGPSEQAAEPVRVRAVLYFNPGMFVQQRRTAGKQLAEIESFVAELNTGLQSPHSRRKLHSISGVVDQKLRKYSLVDAFDITIEEVDIDGRRRRQVRLTLKPEQWDKRRRYDGFCLLVAHPKIRRSAERLCHLYREKNTVEEDIGVIKGLIKIRPFHHRTEAKVRAHVDLCMLALLLERTLRRKLATARSQLSSHAALDLLKHCHLNLYGARDSTPKAYQITRPDQDQSALLRALRLQHLADDEEMADRITPR